MIKNKKQFLNESNKVNCHPEERSELRILPVIDDSQERWSDSEHTCLVNDSTAGHFIMPKNTEGRGEAKEFTLNILPLPLGEGRGEGLKNNSTLTTKTEGWGEATEFTLDSLPLPLGEGRGEGKHWQKALQTATLSLALSFFIAAPVMAADTPPVPTLDRVKAENKTFINSAHSTYTLTELTADETAPEGSITINIADKTYYYTPNAGDNTNTLQLISATGSTALIETTSDKALYTVGDKYYTYTPDKLKDSAYTLTETTVSDPENLPDNVITLYDKTEVTKYYDPTTGLEVAESDRQEGVEYKEVTTIETTPKYYTVSLKQTEYGDKTADSAKPVYFKWTTDADGNKQLTQDGASADDYNIVYYMQTEYGDSNGTTTLTYGWEKNADTGNVEFKQDPQTPVGQTITYKYNPDSFTQKVEGQTSNPTVTNPSSNSSSNSYIIEGGVGLNNSEGSTQSIDNVLYKDNKVTGTLESTTSGSKYGQVSGGAVYNAGELTSISGAFINNGVEAQEIETKGYVFNDAQGGALYNSGTVGNIAADFIGNYASGRKANGGAIFNDGTIGNITGDFIGNYALCEGGAIFNDGTIGNITGDFIGNYVSDSGLGATTYGGAIYNDYGTIGDITGDFIGNYVSGYLWVYGGAIYNSGTIGDITGDFIGNYVSNDDQDYGGGAIYNDDEGTIEDITGDFIGNYASGNTGCSGGAIYNRGTIGNITGDFIGNYASASSTRFSGYGGAIYNRGTIGDITGDFIGNYGEAIYNSGTIGNITGDFIGNYGAKSETNYTSGGAIYNGGGGTIGNITGDFIGNYASSTRYSGYGGAIYNGGGGTIGNITGDFIGNYVSGSGSGATTYGGAIYNYYGTIGDITGDFIGNYAYSNALDAGFPDYPYVYGGAICNYNGEIDNITGDFIGNYTYSYAKRSIDDNLYAQGGAISNVGRDGRYSIIRNITGDFIGNYAYSDRYAKGGAISNGNNATIENITGDFIGNYVSGGYEAQGGAIYNYAHELIGDITGDFIGNYATGDSSAYGGAICNDIGTIGDITGDFIGNYVSSTGYDAYGGAIYNYRTIYNDRGTIVDISGNFIGNYATGDSSAYGGAIYNIGTIGNITGDFIGNYVSSGSSDIYTYAKGGAIYNTGTIGTSDGGIINSSFINNYAKSETGTAQGGAIWTNNDLNIIAKDGGKSVFSGNYIESNGIKTPNAIFVGNPNDTNTTINNITKDTVEYTVETNADYNLPTLTLNASTNGVIIFNDTIEGDGNGTKVIRGDLVVSKWGKEYYGVSTVDEYVNYLKDQDWYDDYTDEEILQEGVEYEELVSINEQTVSETITDGYDLHLTGDSTGAIYLNNEIKNADISIDTTNVYVNEGTNLAPSRSLAVNSGVLNINHLANQTVNFNKFSNSSQINIGSVDVDLANESMGRITADEYGDVSGSVNVQGVKLLSDAKEDRTDILFADEELKGNVTYTGVSPVAYSPIYKYQVSYQPETGEFMFLRGATSTTDPGTDTPIITPPSNPSDAFNPAVLASPVVTQAGAYTTQLQTFNYAFQHADTFMNIPYLERVSIINQGKYAMSPTADATDVGTFSPLLTKEHDPGFWVKPYASFENVPLKNGPKVSNINYGTLVGYDSPLKTISNGFERVLTGYIGYNGASQRYSGVDAYQNGGLIGGTATFYKGNFFNATTLSVGASAGDASTMYGSENYTMLLAGIGNKTGYNFEFFDGGLILQPNMLISYTFVNTFDYNNAAGVRIESDPLHAIQLAPGVKIIGNTKNGWQPYIGVNMVWNLLDDSRVTANGVRLPEMSIKPYVQYGVGVQKRFKDRFLAYCQAMIHNGGRNGVSLTAGLRWKVGK